MKNPHANAIPTVAFPDCSGNVRLFRIETDTERLVDLESGGVVPFEKIPSDLWPRVYDAIHGDGIREPIEVL
jgi:hypothetical protein